MKNKFRVTVTFKAQGNPTYPKYTVNNTEITGSSYTLDNEDISSVGTTYTTENGNTYYNSDSDAGTIVEQDVDIGLIQSISNKYEVNKTAMGVATQPAQNSFVMDMGVKRSYTFSITRISPDEPKDWLGSIENGKYVQVDSTQWSNGFWYYFLKRYLINRWQMETDGCRIKYQSYSVDDEKEDESEFYPTLPSTNAYVSSFSMGQTAGQTNTLSGSITFQIGATNISKEAQGVVITYQIGYPRDTIQNDCNFVKTVEKNQLWPESVPKSWTDYVNPSTTASSDILELKYWEDENNVKYFVGGTSGEPYGTTSEYMTLTAVWGKKQ